MCAHASHDAVREGGSPCTPQQEGTHIDLLRPPRMPHYGRPQPLHRHISTSLGLRHITCVLCVCVFARALEGKLIRVNNLCQLFMLIHTVLSLQRKIDVMLRYAEPSPVQSSPVQSSPVKSWWAWSGCAQMPTHHAVSPSCGMRRAHGAAARARLAALARRACCSARLEARPTHREAGASWCMRQSAPSPREARRPSIPW